MMEEQIIGLTTAQAKVFADRLPEVLRYAVEDRSLTGLDVSLEGVSPAALCVPLTPGQLREIRSCVSFTRQEAEITCCPDYQAAEGILKCRVRYSYVGCDVVGKEISVQAEGALALLCSVRSTPEREWLVISAARRCSLAADGSINAPRRMRSSSEGKGFWHGFASVVEFVVEVVVDAIFD